MHGIQPRTLSNRELTKYAYMMTGKPEGMPLAWQKELLRRVEDADLKDSFSTDYRLESNQHALF